jgi:hypothetical protein
MLRRTFGPRREEVEGSWRRLSKGKLHELNSSPNITKETKSRRWKWRGMYDAWER